MKGDTNVKLHPDHIDRLLACLLSELAGGLNKAEQQFIEQWCNASPENEALYNELRQPGKLSQWISRQQRFEPKAALKRIKKNRRGLAITAPRPAMNWRLSFGSAAAIVLFAVGVLIWYAVQRDHESPSASVTLGTLSDIAPGTHGAILTLADGSQIDLREDHHGIIIGDSVNYVDGTSVVPLAGLKHDNEIPAELSLSTPRGRTYRVTLSDGTKVWLNAASTLRYPQAFKPGTARVVELQGEAYFEVAAMNEPGRDVRLPFKILANDQVVEVLGTEFNISAYPDDVQTSTTLVGGVVRVWAADAQSGVDAVVLSPGEQANLIRGNAHPVESDTHSRESISVIRVQKVDVANFTSWRSGLIVLTDADMQTVVRQIERWYDVTFEFGQTVPSTRWYGEIPRTVPLSEVLEALSKYTDLTFTLEEGRRVIVRN